MKKLPDSLVGDYTQFIENRGVHASKHRLYLKWLRFYLDFCHKYRCGPFEKESLSSFSKKLEDKNQVEELRRQARHSVALFWDMQSHKKTAGSEEIPQKNISLPSGTFQKHNKIKPHYQAGRDRQRSFNEKISDSRDSRTTVCKPKGYDWTGVYEKLENAIMLRHYSVKTLKSYTYWTRKFQTFLKSKNPQLVEVDDIKSFLTYLAVEEGVSASSQNLAFNSLLFLFRNVFGQGVWQSRWHCAG